MSGTEVVGVVLGSLDATPLDFWIGVEAGHLVQLDDLVVVTENGVSWFGIVDQVRKRFEGQSFDSDAFRAAAGTLPVETSYAAHVQVTRIDPEVFAPPQPGVAARIVRGDDFARALYFDTMERKVPVGITRAGETIYANLEFLDGTRGAHASISGISGVATKTSYATFVLYSLFHSGVLGADGINSKALVFNVKGEDLLWLDRPNARLTDAHRQTYARLGLPAGPFSSVGLFAPAKKHVQTLVPDTGSRQEGVSPYCWTMREFAREKLLRFCFADADDGRQQLSFVVTRVERALELEARASSPKDPGLLAWGHRITTFDELLDVLDSQTLDDICPNIASGTLDAFRRRLHAAAQHMGHLVRGGQEAVGREIQWANQQVTVVDIHSLHSVAQLFVVGVILKRMMEEKELSGGARPLVFVLLDELNKYAPRSGWSPIRDVLLDIAERGRSLGVSLFGCQQTASEVERRVVSNAALRIVGRLDAAEAGRAEYGYLTGAARVRAAMLQPGTMIVAQPEIPAPVLVRFPFPAWATRKSEAVTIAKADPFAGFHEED